MSDLADELAPDAEPPDTDAALGTSRPEELSDEEDALTAALGELPATAADAAATWQSDKRVLALWGIDEPRNSWIRVDGLGWRKLAATTDSGVVGMTMLGALARQTGRPVRFREDDAGVVYELYVW